MPKPKPARRRPAPVAAPVPTAEPKRRLKHVLPVIADVAVGVILLGLAVFLGETLAGKPTRQLWHDAGGAVKFPPIELIQWIGPVAVIMLTYALLVSKGVSVGGWLRRRMVSV